jgi:hypothetical protein
MMTPNIGKVKLNPDWLISEEETYSWAQVRDASRPAMTGSPNWQKYMRFLEAKLVEYGAVDVVRNSWTYDRWWTAEKPEKWGLVSDGREVKVAFYGAYSGSTKPEGITAELIYCDPKNPPPSMKGKIVVIPTMPHPEPPYDQDYIQNFRPDEVPWSTGYLVDFTLNDYEYRVDDEAFPPILEFIDPAETFSYDIWWQMAQELHFVALKGGALGLVIVYDMAYDRTKGLYFFPVPEAYDCPCLILDREEGAKVIADAFGGKTATLRLEATVEQAEAYQLIAYLPGKNYGTPQDEQLLLVTHTDGPSITQDNGALGVLAIVKYFSHMPQEERQRTLAIFLDCRHYMPGMELTHFEPDWFRRNPEAKEPIVGMIHMEHLGEMEYREVDGKVEPTGFGENAYLWVRNNPLLIDTAIQAAKHYRPSKLQVVVPERPGVHGEMQQKWWGIGVIGIGEYEDEERIQSVDVPGFGFASFLGNYWSVQSGIEMWSVDQHMKQVNMMTYLVNFLMIADLDDIHPLQEKG